MNSQMVGLQSLLMHEAVECGVYIGCGSRNVSNLVLDILARRPQAPIIWIDAGNSFDPYRLAVTARRYRLDPRALLKSIQVSRPFTAFQLHEVLAKVPRAKGANPPLVIISDLMGLFYDGDLQEEDMERAFRQFQVRLTDLGRRAVVVGLVVDQAVPARRNHLLLPVLSLARRVFSPPCTARQNLTAPVRRLALAAASFLLIGGWTLMKRIIHG